ncbi:hypothetical protein LIER_14652 [Lithospermum erythrorhizon]|uniref:Uncharacterized protein n=1 Tax=Lithospermum erythrorhizon TaxID=34254 RepID=A0AAV3PZX1_LITER
MGYMSYNKIGKRCPGMRGIKLNIRRFKVQVLRSKFLIMFKFLKYTYKNCLESLKKNIARKKRKEDERIIKDVMMEVVPYKHVKDFRLKSFARSNSFYSEAIADCLDFIKRNSVSLDEEKPVLVSNSN